MNHTPPPPLPFDVELAAWCGLGVERDSGRARRVAEVLDWVGMAEGGGDGLEDVAGRDLYAELGLGVGATAKEVKKAYRVRARAVHPDHNPGVAGAAEAFDAVHRAYEVLGNAKLKLVYDAMMGAVHSRKRSAAAMADSARAAADDLATREAAARSIKRAKARADADAAVGEARDAAARAALRAELDALRAARAAPPPSPAAPGAADDGAAATLVVKWAAADAALSPADVKALFELFGRVDSWVHKAKAAKDGGAPRHKALVVMADPAAAAAALAPASAAAWARRGISVRQLAS